MRVLVRVEMRNRNTRGLNLAELRRRLSGNFVRVHASGDGAQRKRLQVLAEGARMSSSRERRNLSDIKNWHAIDQNHMAADTQTWHAFRQAHSPVESRAICHQGGGSYDTACMSLGDGAIDA